MEEHKLIELHDRLKKAGPKGGRGGLGVGSSRAGQPYNFASASAYVSINSAVTHCYWRSTSFTSVTTYMHLLSTFYLQHQLLCFSLSPAYIFFVASCFLGFYSRENLKFKRVDIKLPLLLTHPPHLKKIPQQIEVVG